MHNTSQIYILVLLTAFIMSCERRYSLDKIREAPQINKDFYNKALAHLNASIEDYPDNADNYYKKALVLIELENPGTAMLQARKAVSLNPNDPEYLFLLARLYAMNEKTDSAIETALLASKNGASKARLNSLLAEMYFKTDSLELAMEYVNQALAEGSSQSFNQLLKGKIAHAMGDSVTAEASFVLAADDPVNKKEAYLSLVRLYDQQGRYDKTLSLLESLLRENPQDKAVLFKKANVQSKLGQTNEAKYTFLELIKRDSLYEEAYAKVSFIYFQQYQYDSASYYAERALALDKNFTDPMIVQARILDRRRQYYPAMQKYAEILAIDSTHTTAQVELQNLRRKMAYFQRQREEEQQKETLEVPSINPIF